MNNIFNVFFGYRTGIGNYSDYDVFRCQSDLEFELSELYHFKPTIIPYDKTGIEFRLSSTEIRFDILSNNFINDYENIKISLLLHENSSKIGIIESIFFIHLRKTINDSFFVNVSKYNERSKVFTSVGDFEILECEYKNIDNSSLDNFSTEIYSYTLFKYNDIHKILIYIAFLFSENIQIRNLTFNAHTPDVVIDILKNIYYILKKDIEI